MTNYPEKTCSIEKLVTIPEDVQKVLQGDKWATRRNGVYAYPGETFQLEGKDYTVEKLYSQTLGELTDEDAKSEGHETVEEYKQAMLSIHDKMPWLPKMKVWVHEYSPSQK